MKNQIICIGKIKEKYWTQAIAEYSKRLSRFCTLVITEKKESRLPDRASAAEEENVRISEGRSILSAIPEDAFVIALDICGKNLDSEQLAEKMQALTVQGVSHIVWLIGGSLGLSDEVLRRADFRLSFSPMTFPHQMMRVILLEQIYRGYKIIHHEKYHK